MPETTSHTWTQHTFLCQSCKKVCYASQESIDATREAEGDDPHYTDKEIAEGFEFCLGCVDGKLIAGEKVALQPLRVFVHEADERGWARWDANECDISECFPNDVDEAIRVRAELEENGYAWVGGGAAQLFLITRKPGQLTDSPARPIPAPDDVDDDVDDGDYIAARFEERSYSDIMRDGMDE